MYKGIEFEGLGKMFIGAHPLISYALSVNEALFLDRLHYWINKKGVLKDGRMWVYNSLSDWHIQLYFLSQPTINNVVYKLRDKKIIHIGKYGKSRSDRTNWYSIDYEVLEEVVIKGVDEFINNISSVYKNYNSSLYKRQSEFIKIIKSYKEQYNKKYNNKTLKEAAPEKPPDAVPFKEDIKTDVQEDTDLIDQKAIAKRLREAARKKKLTPISLELHWKSTLSEQGISHFLPFTGREKGNAKSFIKQFEDSEVDLRDFLDYCIINWESLRLKTKENKKTLLTKIPRFENLFTFKHELLSLYKQGYLPAGSKETVYADVSEVPQDHPMRDTILRMIKNNGKAVLRG